MVVMLIFSHCALSPNCPQISFVEFPQMSSGDIQILKAMKPDAGPRINPRSNHISITRGTEEEVSENQKVSADGGWTSYRSFLFLGYLPLNVGNQNVNCVLH
jgi:hypothetical protein